MVLVFVHTRPFFDVQKGFTTPRGLKKYRFVNGVLIRIRKNKLLIGPFYIIISTPADQHYFYAHPDSAFHLLRILIRSVF
jgi:hypothetical protein